MEFKFDITGMTCAACSARVEKVTKQINGVERVEVNLLANRMVVQARDTTVVDEIITAVSRAGYGAKLKGGLSNSASKNDSLKEMKLRIIFSVILLVVLMYFTMGHMVGLPAPVWYCGVENAMIAALLQFVLTLPLKLYSF